MSEIGKYCCFNCPGPDTTLRRLDDVCPDCGMEYGFPLTAVPSGIGDFTVERSLGRGFYGATYVARRKGPLKTQRVLKVSPKAMYEKFSKTFADEVERHAAVAEGADHVIAIEQMFDADITFGETTISCHVAELQFVDGEPLGRYLSGAVPLSAAEASQIACDLFRIKEEFENARSNHNDLHANNLIVQRLRADRRRPDAIEPGVRAMAIDLGSVAEDRRSGGDYLGDWHWIGRHIHSMAERLLAGGDDADDLEKRMALKLDAIAQSLVPATENQRPPAAADFIRTIRDEYYRTAEPWRPWRERMVLRTFEESYNAQTLDAWYVPQLLVDPEGAWLARVSAPGPLVMTGMRGCGKTMLLHSLQFHARATVRPTEQDEDALRRIRVDGYVGLFVSAQRLIPVSPKEERTPAEELFARLLVAYAAAAARALAHLQDLDPSALAHDACARIASAVADALVPVPEMPELANVEQLERFLTNLLNLLSRSDSRVRLASGPSTAFPRLAEAVRAATCVWNGAQVLFLLDDVSTRYLDADRIEELLSVLIFQNPVCAFKVTSEAQTIFLTLKSPGQQNPAASGRDFATFDLGAEVYARLKRPGGSSFINSILNARARLFPGHPRATPREVIGDVDLETIAKGIVGTGPKSRDRKKLYRGMSALAGVCVGDIGSVIQIYQRILAGNLKTLPVPDQAQNDVFQDFCARYLYHLDRRGSDLKAVATGFAEASHQLLMESGHDKPTGRLRQYTAMYVRVTSGNVAAQMSRLRDLVDAGVFVFAGGAPRTKTHDSNPTQQFKLTFRKIFGLVNFIGLSERDRFELSGADLEEWLTHPERGKEVLLRNLSRGVIVDPDEDGDGDEEGSPRPLERVATPVQLVLPHTDAADEPAPASAGMPFVAPTLPTVRRLNPGDLAKVAVDTLVVGLGFEQRTPASLERILSQVTPRRILGVGYNLDGRREEMVSIAGRHGLEIDEVPYGEVERGMLPQLPPGSLIDVTGLAKAALFRFVREGLRDNGGVRIAYTAAERYFPLETDLAAVLDAHGSYNRHLLLAALKDVLTGEKAPYHLVSLLSMPSDGTRLRALSAFASPKHERILHLIEARDYDAVEIVTDAADTSRAKVGEIAAAVALEGSPGGRRVAGDANDLGAILQILGQRHHDWYVRGGMNFEVGLTGNKHQATAAAILTAALPVNEVWYVAPAEFDVTRFTEGVGASTYYEVEIRSGPAGRPV